MKRYLQQKETLCKTVSLTEPPKGYIYIEKVFDVYIINGILNHLKKSKLRETVNGQYIKYDIHLNYNKYVVQENDEDICPEFNDLLEKVQEIIKRENLNFDFNQLLIYQYGKNNRQERTIDNSLGESLIIISFGEPCEMLMVKQLEDNNKNIYKKNLEINSLLILSNEAKKTWKYETLKPKPFHLTNSYYTPKPNYKRTTITLKKV